MSVKVLLRDVVLPKKVLSSEVRNTNINVYSLIDALDDSIDVIFTNQGEVVFDKVTIVNVKENNDRTTFDLVAKLTLDSEKMHLLYLWETKNRNFKSSIFATLKYNNQTFLLEQYSSKGIEFDI